MDLIFDTHALAWYSAGSRKFSRIARQEVDKPETRIFVSAVTAWEYADLIVRARLPGAAPFDALRSRMGFEILGLPVELWRAAQTLPNIHRDPIDRMLVAHAIEAGLTLVTADAAMQAYPVKTLW